MSQTDTDNVTDSDEEVDHEADVKCEVDLLAGVLDVGKAVLHSFSANQLLSHCQASKTYLYLRRGVSEVD